ncbi:UDP-N-acetylmuramoyl-L-alanyl-D-glutamate--2,6-diaminopimelate ligase [bacterium]|nr:UDP-N-acetylmuramoyl-L-alanyl-D-glutamate--2,6-diaminopimelate ligase [bacterium]
MLSLAELAETVGGELRNSNGSTQVARVSYDSRCVQQGDVFVAIAGFKEDGSKYIKQALANGAVGIIGESAALSGISAACIVVPSSRAALAKAAWTLQGSPERELTLIGVTGTNGKTTVSVALAQLLNLCGIRAGYSGTLGMFFGDIQIESERTTAEAPELAAAFRRMRDQGCTHIAMEATSIGIELQRIGSLRFDVSVFTNLSRDHLDFHGSWEAYRDAKAKLFAPEMLNGTAVINIDDPAHEHFQRVVRGKILTYGVEKSADYRAIDISLSANGSQFTLLHPNGRSQVRSRLVGQFNVMNMLAVISAAQALGLEIDDILSAVQEISPVRGRAEVVRSSAPFTVVVDYAHTPDALNNILSTMKALTKGRLCALVGAGGNRDKGKRPLMAQAAERWCDVLYLTSDNPRTESPNAIIDDLLMGIQDPGKMRVVIDRKAAILEALSAAKQSDVIVIAGKGHEAYQEIMGEKLPFDDRAVAEQWLRANGY